MLEDYTRKRWEGKPLSFKFKYWYANYPSIAISTFVIFFSSIVIGGYRMYTFPGSRYDVISKYKLNYVVVRDDDPNLDKIIAEKEAGRHHFPKL